MLSQVPLLKPGMAPAMVMLTGVKFWVTRAIFSLSLIHFSQFKVGVVLSPGMGQA
jgi:hypothetical protein